MATLANYPYTRRISPRWKDNDVYGHVNNVEYYSFFDTVINEYLILEAGLDIHAGEVIGLCAESHCSFAAPVAFPGVVQAGLAVEHLGNASVRYAIGLFDGAEAGGSGAEAGAETAPLLAEGWFVHVFVDRHQRRPTAIPAHIRPRLEAIAR
jgi:acyl-CoA thioester hydrolase